MSYFDAVDVLLEEMYGLVGKIWADSDWADTKYHTETLIGTPKAIKCWYCDVATVPICSQQRSSSGLICSAFEDFYTTQCKKPYTVLKKQICSLMFIPKCLIDSLNQVNIFLGAGIQAFKKAWTIKVNRRLFNNVYFLTENANLTTFT